jgi:hypothetical protein
MARLLDTPAHLADEMRLVRGVMVLERLERGMTEDEIFRRGIDVAIRAARLEGADEIEVEVVACQARRDIAQALREIWGDAP